MCRRFWTLAGICASSCKRFYAAFGLMSTIMTGMGRYILLWRSKKLRSYRSIYQLTTYDCCG